ncbi:MAG: hypothetical protein JXR40_03190 [Pontiellaceae bacterium]|nr:hypothetical protein [Pontiellaceae bacterium]
MKKYFILCVLFVCVTVRGELMGGSQDAEGGSKKEIRTWTTADGKETMEGEYSAMSGDMVMIRKADNKIQKVALTDLSDEDRLYIEYKNPPKLKVEFRRSTKYEEYIADPWYSNQGWANENHPIYITTAEFGAKVVQTDPRLYNHDLVLEVYVLTEQRYEPDNMHIIAHFKSKPFRLTPENKFEFEFFDKNIYTILEYALGSEYTRGEELSKYMVLVRDERNEVIAYNGDNEWMYKYLDRLEKLPIGAWINNKCIRIHPTSPRWGE